MVWLSNVVVASAAEHNLSTHIAVIGFQRQSSPILFFIQSPYIKYNEQATLS